MLSVEREIAFEGRREAAGTPEPSLLKNLVVLARHRRFIVSGMLIAAAMTALIVLVIPATYTASTVILTSQNSSGSASALLGQLGALAALGGDSLLKSQADTFVEVLRSRTVADNLIQDFHLQSVYRKRTLVDTRKALARHTHIEATKGSSIRISVDDHDVRRAAAMANAYVDELYHVNQHLALTTGSQRRLFLEQQVSAESETLAKTEEAFQKLQQKTGVIQLVGQQEMTLRSIAQLRAEISAKEVQMEQLRTMATEQNGQLQQLESGVSALREQLRKAESDSGGGDNYFVSAGRIPQAGLEYLRQLRNLRYHEALFETLSKQYELARIEEAKAPQIIQVLDKAIVLDKRSWPPRTLLVLLALLTSGILLATGVLLKDRWTRMAEEPENAPHLDALRNLLHSKKNVA
ncbi:MAG: lipopolysaccharide biosynthesis protein [Silvibacterium sp.]|nr:lipopolysaccharide biosynthesis protein [Silvibacterium sp.]